MQILGRDVPITARGTAMVLFALLAGLAVLGGITRWFAPAPAPPSAEFAAATPAAAVATVDKVLLPAAPLKAYPKATAVKKLDLSPALACDAGKQVLASGIVPPRQGVSGVSAIAVLDTRTHDSEIQFRAIPPPFVELENAGAVGVRYGINSSLAQEGTVYGRWNLLRIGAVHLGAYGEINTRAEAKAQASIEYRW